MHPALRRIAKSTEGTPYEGALWLVGGAVRDELLGKQDRNDFDIVTEHDAVELAHFLRQKSVSEIEPVVYPRFGTALVHVEGLKIELATARKESYDDQSRKPEVEPATLQDDARRRDFTVNALMRNLHTEELWDPLGCGMEDLQTKTLRTPLDPEATFYDDPLRMLRAVRFRWQLEFEPAPGLYEAIREESHRLRIISAERIRDEWIRMLVNEHAPEAMQDLMDLGLLHEFAPEFEPMIGVDQGSYHHLDVWEHSLLVLRNVGPGNLTLALAALFHDIGKPATRFIDETGHTRFFGHDDLGAKVTEQILRRLKFPLDEIEPVVALVKSHMRLGSMKEFTKTAARRLIRDLGEWVDPLLQLVAADVDALKPGVRKFNVQPIRDRLHEVESETPREKLQSPLSGQEIMELTGLPPGPEVGRLKAMLTEKVLEGELPPDDKDSAAKILQTLATNNQ